MFKLRQQNTYFLHTNIALSGPGVFVSNKYDAFCASTAYVDLINIAFATYTNTVLTLIRYSHGIGLHIN